MAQELMTVEDLAVLLNVTPSWVYEHKRDIPHIKLGKYLRFPRAEIDRWIASLYAAGS
jgi:excisionase family DNA binding protein